MVSNHLLKFLVNTEELNKIKIKASAQGHKTISSFLRESTLNSFQEKVLLELFYMRKEIREALDNKDIKS